MDYLLDFNQFFRDNELTRNIKKQEVVTSSVKPPEPSKPSKLVKKKSTVKKKAEEEDDEIDMTKYGHKHHNKPGLGDQ